MKIHREYPGGKRTRIGVAGSRRAATGLGRGRRGLERAGTARAVQFLVWAFLLLPGTSWANQVDILWDADSPNSNIPAGRTCDLVDAVIDTTDKAEGTGSMRVHNPGGQGAMGCTGFENTSLGGSWYNGEWVCMSFYMKIHPDFEWDINQNKFKMQRLKQGSSSVLTLYMERGGVWISDHNYGAYQNGVECTQNCFRNRYDMHPPRDGGTNPVDSWQGYTIGMKRQSAEFVGDGELVLWVNGTEVGRQTGLEFCRGCSNAEGDFRDSWGGFGTQPYPQSPEGTIWFDYVEVSTGSSECAPRLAPDGVVDTTAPSAPILLEAQASDPNAPSDPGPTTDAALPEPFCPGGTNPQPEVIFCDNFDGTGTLSQRYFEYESDDGDFVEVPAQGLGGSQALRALWQAGEVDAGNIKRSFGRSPQSSQSHSNVDFREIYWRHYLRMEPGFSGSPRKLSRATSLVSSANWAQSMIAHLWNSRGTETLSLDPASGTDEAGNLQTTQYNDFANLRWLGAREGATPLFRSDHADQWFCIEAHVKFNTPGQSDGIFEYWIDDQLEARRSDLNWVGSYEDYGINALFLENYWNDGAPSELERYFDNLVISTERIGCGPTTLLNAGP